MTMKISTIIKEWVPNKSKVIDFGCGDGTLLKDLIKEKDVQGYGIEIDDKKRAEYDKILSSIEDKPIFEVP